MIALHFRGQQLITADLAGGETGADLNAGAQVVVRGNEALRNGQRVVLLPATTG